MSIPSDVFEKLIESKMRQSFDDMILADTGENLAKLKQVSVLKDWFQKAKQTGGVSNNDAGSPIVMIKKLIADNLTKGSSAQISQSIRERLQSEIKSRLGKGLDLPPIPIPPIKPNVIFSLNVDGLPVRNNMLKLAFEIDPILHAKGVTAMLESAEKLFSVSGMSVELKLYILTPMMIGMKRTKIGQQTFNIMENLKFAL